MRAPQVHTGTFDRRIALLISVGGSPTDSGESPELPNRDRREILWGRRFGDERAFTVEFKAGILSRDELVPKRRA